MNTKKPY